MCLVCIEWAKFPNSELKQEAIDRLYYTGEVTDKHYIEVVIKIETNE